MHSSISYTAYKTSYNLHTTSCNLHSQIHIRIDRRRPIERKPDTDKQRQTDRQNVKQADADTSEEYQRPRGAYTNRHTSRIAERYIIYVGRMPNTQRHIGRETDSQTDKCTEEGKETSKDTWTPCLPIGHTNA